MFLPVHAYMFATAGAQIIEVVDMEEIAAEKQYEFAFLGLPAQAARRDGRADAVLRGAAAGLMAGTTSLGWRGAGGPRHPGSPCLGRRLRVERGDEALERRWMRGTPRSRARAGPSRPPAPRRARRRSRARRRPRPRTDPPPRPPRLEAAERGTDPADVLVVQVGERRRVEARRPPPRGRPRRPAPEAPSRAPARTRAPPPPGRAGQRVRSRRDPRAKDNPAGDAAAQGTRARARRCVRRTGRRLARQLRACRRSARSCSTTST